MFVIGYWDGPNGTKVELVTMGKGATIALALQDAASAMLDDEPVTNVNDALQHFAGFVQHCSDYVITWVADPVQPDGIAMYLQG